MAMRAGRWRRATSCTWCTTSFAATQPACLDVGVGDQGITWDGGAQADGGGGPAARGVRKQLSRDPPCTTLGYP